MGPLLCSLKKTAMKDWQYVLHRDCLPSETLPRLSRLILPGTHGPCSKVNRRVTIPCASVNEEPPFMGRSTQNHSSRTQMSTLSLVHLSRPPYRATHPWSCVCTMQSPAVLLELSRKKSMKNIEERRNKVVS